MLIRRICLLPDMPSRSVKKSIKRGWLLKCPACGKGKLFLGYLTVNSSCDICGEELYHHRADDGPAWVTILITGHIIAPLMLFVFQTFRPQGWTMALGFTSIFLTLVFFLLPRIKGMFVSHQWANYLFGFGILKRGP